MCRTTARSWAMKRYVRPSSVPAGSRAGSRSAPGLETSSADTGSSLTMKEGFTARARARPIRCLWPPENSCGVATPYRWASPLARAARRLRVQALADSPQARASESVRQRIRPTLCRGLSEADGSSKTILICRRIPAGGGCETTKAPVARGPSSECWVVPATPRVRQAHEALRAARAPGPRADGRARG